MRALLEHEPIQCTLEVRTAAQSRDRVRELRAREAALRAHLRAGGYHWSEALIELAVEHGALDE